MRSGSQRAVVGWYVMYPLKHMKAALTATIEFHRDEREAQERLIEDRQRCVRPQLVNKCASVPNGLIF